MKCYKVRILRSAYNDLKEARSWYKQHSAELPKRFSQQVNMSIDRVREVPFAHTTRYKEVRIANISVFPYAIHYFITDNTIIIIAIHHTALSPDKWINRL